MLTKSVQDLDVYLDLFRKGGGIRGALNWYKNRAMNSIEEQAAGLSPNIPSHIPCLQMPAEFDAVGESCPVLVARADLS